MSHLVTCDSLALGRVAIQGGSKETKPLSFRACNFRSIDQIGTKFEVNQRYFILNVTS